MHKDLQSCPSQQACTTRHCHRAHRSAKRQSSFLSLFFPFLPSDININISSISRKFSTKTSPLAQKTWSNGQKIIPGLPQYTQTQDKHVGPLLSLTFSLLSFAILSFAFWIIKSFLSFPCHKTVIDCHWSAISQVFTHHPKNDSNKKSRAESYWFLPSKLLLRHLAAGRPPRWHPVPAHQPAG